MNRNRGLALAVAGVVVAAAAWFYFRPRTDRVAIDLIKEFPTAKQKRPSDESFTIVDATLNGETRKSIAFTGTTRIRWQITVPDNGLLRVSLGIKEEAWKEQGADGVTFYIHVSDGANADDALFKTTVNPAGVPADRRWQDIELDLSQYAGESVELNFNTYTSVGGGNNAIGDLGLWGEPRVVVR